jgi:tRNA-dihydrouridine synthase
MNALQPLTIHGRGRKRSVVFSSPLLLAPMEGITEACFRDLVIGLGGVGGACTEFIRISNSAAPARVIRRHLGGKFQVPSSEFPVGEGHAARLRNSELGTRNFCPVGVQLMAPDTAHLAESVANATAAGADFIDLNFGCPAPVVFNKSAGSALLCRPEALAEIAACACAATELPVSVKIRAGIDGTQHLGEIIAALSGSAVAMLTLHARLRVHSYAQPAQWEWIAQASRLMKQRGCAIPLIGNGSVERAADVPEIMRQTGCDGVMIGRAALADPWIFNEAIGGSGPSREEAAAFAVAYAERLRDAYGERTAMARLKQLIKYYRAGDLFHGCDEKRQELLRAPNLDIPLAWFRESCSRSQSDSRSAPAEAGP